MINGGYHDNHGIRRCVMATTGIQEVFEIPVGNESDTEEKSLQLAFQKFRLKKKVNKFLSQGRIRSMQYSVGVATAIIIGAISF